MSLFVVDELRLWRVLFLLAASSSMQGQVILIDQCDENRDCSPSQPGVNCHLYITDCYGSVLQDPDDYPAPPEHFQVKLKYSEYSGCDTPNLAVSWIAPNNYGAKVLKGFRLEVTPLHQLFSDSVCLRFEFPTVNWTSELMRQKIQFETSCLRLMANFRYDVRLESLPRKGSDGTFCRDCEKTIERVEKKTSDKDGKCVAKSTTELQTTSHRHGVTDALPVISKDDGAFPSHIILYSFVAVILTVIIVLIIVNWRHLPFKPPCDATATERETPPSRRGSLPAAATPADLPDSKRQVLSQDSGVFENEALCGISIPPSVKQGMIPYTDSDSGYPVSELMRQIHLANHQATAEWQGHEHDDRDVDIHAFAV